MTLFAAECRERDFAVHCDCEYLTDYFRFLPTHGLMQNKVFHAEMLPMDTNRLNGLSYRAAIITLPCELLFYFASVRILDKDSLNVVRLLLGYQPYASLTLPSFSFKCGGVNDTKIKKNLYK